MMFSGHLLVDKEVLTFTKWRVELHKEDLREYGCIIKRSIKDLKTLYKSYNDFQTRDDVSEYRKEKL